jgi:hypothetical protein
MVLTLKYKTFREARVVSASDASGLPIRRAAPTNALPAKRKTSARDKASDTLIVFFSWRCAVI